MKKDVIGARIRGNRAAGGVPLFRLEDVSLPAGSLLMMGRKRAYCRPMTWSIDAAMLPP